MNRLIARVAGLVIVALLLAFPAPANAASNTKVLRAVGVAVNQVGDWYQWGGAGPNRFDCSGLVYYSYRKAGIAVPRTAQQQANRTHRIKRNAMRRGDLMFFHDSRGRVYHVAIFLRWEKGRRLMLESARPGTRVHRTVPWSNAWWPGTLTG